MPIVNVNDQPCMYEIEGDGFPLLLASGPYDAISLWHPLMSLLGELCKAITYAYRPWESSEHASGAVRSDVRARDFLALLDIFALERVYLAAASPAMPMLAQIVQQASMRLEGLILIGKAEDGPSSLCLVGQASTIPTLLLVGENDPEHCRWAARQVAHAPHVRQRLVPGAGTRPLHEQPQRLGHMMIEFLLHCERQRNLVRGASFLL